MKKTVKLISLALAAAMLFGAAPHVAAADGWSVLEQQLDAQLAQDNDTNYNGYLVKIKDNISKKRAASLEKKAAAEGVRQRVGEFERRAFERILRGHEPVGRRRRFAVGDVLVTRFVARSLPAVVEYSPVGVGGRADRAPCRR